MPTSDYGSDPLCDAARLSVEEKLLWAEDQIDALNLALYRCERDGARLTARIERLEHQLQVLLGAVQGATVQDASGARAQAGDEADSLLARYGPQR